jgi:hypothetical protein
MDWRQVASIAELGYRSAADTLADGGEGSFWARLRVHSPDEVNRRRV